MKNLLSLGLMFFLGFQLTAQLTLQPSGANQKSVVTQYMGGHANVTITYNSPDVSTPQGVSRKGKIWGQTVPYGLNPLFFGISNAENPSPWRAGANENTIVEFSHDVEIEGKPLAAGKYGFHVIPMETGPWTLIFSNNSAAWGSYFYKVVNDALRVEVNPYDSEYEEWLTFEFSDRQETSCTAALKWENKAIPFKITLPGSQEIYLAHLREAMDGSTGFNWSMRDQAANYCMNNDVNLAEALTWAEATSVNSFIGSENATTLTTLAGLQIKNGKKEEGMSTILKAANHNTAAVSQIHNMGRMIMGMGDKETALKIFQVNETRNGNVWPVNVGLARGYAAVGMFDKAVAHCEKAIENAPNKPNKDALAGMLVKLKNGEDVN